MKLAKYNLFDFELHAITQVLGFRHVDSVELIQKLGDEKLKYVGLDTPQFLDILNNSPDLVLTEYVGLEVTNMLDSVRYKKGSSGSEEDRVIEDVHILSDNSTLLQVLFRSYLLSKCKYLYLSFTDYGRLILNNAVKLDELCLRAILRLPNLKGISFNLEPDLFFGYPTGDIIEHGKLIINVLSQSKSIEYIRFSKDFLGFKHTDIYNYLLTIKNTLTDFNKGQTNNRIKLIFGDS